MNFNQNHFTVIFPLFIKTKQRKYRESFKKGLLKKWSFLTSSVVVLLILYYAS